MPMSNTQSRLYRKRLPQISPRILLAELRWGRECEHCTCGNQGTRPRPPLSWGLRLIQNTGLRRQIQKLALHGHEGRTDKKSLAVRQEKHKYQEKYLLYKNSKNLAIIRVFFINA